MKSTLILFTFVFCISFSFNSSAQEVGTDSTKTKQLYLIVKNDGSEYIGVVLSDDGREVLIETETLGKIYIPKSDIKSMTAIDDNSKIVNGDYQAEGPFTTRYSFTTNALPIKKGENYAMINLFGPEVHFAVSDHLNIGVMSTWFVSPILIALKYSIKTKNEKVNFSLGTLMGSTGYLNNFRGFGGLHFANVTFGDRNKNITLGGGYAYLKTGGYGLPEPGIYYGDSYSNIRAPKPMEQGPIFSIAGIAKVGAKASFIFDSMIGVFFTENRTVVTTEITPSSFNPNPPYEYIPGNYKFEVTAVKTITTALFLMPGMRFQTKENSAFQFSLAGVSVFSNNDNFSFPIPMCSWFFKF